MSEGAANCRTDAALTVWAGLQHEGVPEPGAKKPLCRAPAGRTFWCGGSALTEYEERYGHRPTGVANPQRGAFDCLRALRWFPSNFPGWLGASAAYRRQFGAELTQGAGTDPQPHSIGEMQDSAKRRVTERVGCIPSVRCAPRWSVIAADGPTRPLRVLQIQHAWVAEFHAARSAAITAAPRNQSALVH